MICYFCNGSVKWMGPFSALTHTQCLDCGRQNCQQVEDAESEDRIADASNTIEE